MLLALRRCCAYYVNACAAVNHYFYLPPYPSGAALISAQKFPVSAGELAENFCKLFADYLAILAAGTLFCVDEWILAKLHQRVNNVLQFFYHVA